MYDDDNGTIIDAVSSYEPSVGPIVLSPSGGVGGEGKTGPPEAGEVKEPASASMSASASDLSVPHLAD